MRKKSTIVASFGISRGTYFPVARADAVMTVR
jgi:hypothetical protein